MININDKSKELNSKYLATTISNNNVKINNIKLSNISQLYNNKKYYKVIFVLGNAGSGKNTQCDLLKEYYNLTHFSCGDLLRAEANKVQENQNSNSDQHNSVSILINNCIKEGKIVPANITCQLAKEEMNKKGKDNIYLIDGFPRNTENLEGWYKVFESECVILGVLEIDCKEETCIERIQLRSKQSGRIDDNLDSLKKRFKVFKEETLTNINLMSKVTNIIKIDGNKDNREEVFNLIKTEFDKLLC